MAIVNPNPVVLPPRAEEKVYGNLWVLSLRVQAPSDTEGSIMFEVAPYDSESGDILKAQSKRYYLDLWDAATHVPEAAMAIGAIYNAVVPVLTWDEERRNPTTTEEPEEESTTEEPGSTTEEPESTTEEPTTEEPSNED